MEKYIEKPMRNYLDDLWAKKPAPGGGSVAALSGALGISLVGMVVNFTVGKPGYEAHREELDQILKATRYLKVRFEELVDLDVAVYSKVRDIFKKKLGKEALEELYKEAAGVPIETCRLAYDGMKACPVVADWGNKGLISDIGIAAELLASAFYSAKLNVDSNMNYITDKQFIEKTKSEIGPLEKNIESLKSAVLVKVKDIVYGKY